MGSRREYIFENLALRLPWQPIKFRGLDKKYMFGRELLKEPFCKTFLQTAVES